MWPQPNPDTRGKDNNERHDPLHTGFRRPENQG